MYTKGQYFIFNKKLDFIRGCCKNLIYQDGVLKKEDTKKSGYFLSRVLDCGERDMVWHRLVLKGAGENSAVKIKIYCTGQPGLTYKGRSFPVKELAEGIQGEEGPVWQAAMEQACVKSTLKDCEVLLHDVRGRYLWFSLEFPQMGDIGEIQAVKIEFPKRSWMEYLPQFYQSVNKNADFLERFLLIFQTLYEDLTDEIEHITRKLDPDSADGEFLSWISGWIFIDDIPAWSLDKLRYLLKNSMNLYKIRGTAGYLKEILRLYTNGEAYIVEYHQISRYKYGQAGAERMKRLYGGDETIFTVLVNTPKVYTSRELQTLVNLVDHGNPAHMESRVVQLKQCIFLDQYTYLGINSRLGDYMLMRLNGLCALDFTKI